MRGGLVTLVGMCALAVGLLGGTASAAPAEHYSFGGCDVFGQYEYCSSWRGVGKITATPSGNVIFSGHGSFSSSATYVPTGEVVSTFSGKDNSGSLWKDGGLHGYHAVFRSWWSSAGLTCSSSYRVALANGELRHEQIAFDCS